MRITTNNGTTISGSLSEVLAALTHLGVKAEDVKPVTTVNVSGTMVTKAVDVDKIAQSITAKLHAGETVMSKVVATPVPVPKPARDSVIKMAIADVKDLLSREYYASWNEDGAVVAKHVGSGVDFRMGTDSDRVDFFVNAGKGVVVAKLTFDTASKPLKNRIYKTQGRAKCAPGDVFNEHIGKAIALRRALGLEVPVEYFTVEARDRDDLAVGDLVSDDEIGCDAIYEITKLIDNPNMSRYPGQAFVRKGGFGWLASSQVTLINDSARYTAPDLEVSRIIRH